MNQRYTGVKRSGTGIDIELRSRYIDSSVLSSVPHEGEKSTVDAKAREVGGNPFPLTLTPNDLNGSEESYKALYE